MPSLRRTFSNPIPRRAPYSSSTVAARGNGHRRSSGSETTNRRVLADIEWWRVTDGQRESLADQESEDVNRGTSDLALEVALGTGFFASHALDDGVEHLSMPTPWTPELVEDVLEPSLAPPTEQFAVMSLTPQTPVHRHLSLESSDSSVESSPELPPTPLDGLGLRFSVMDVDFFEEENRPARQISNPYGSVSPLVLPSLKLDELSMKADFFSGQDDYADFSSSPLFCAPDFLNCNRSGSYTKPFAKPRPTTTSEGTPFYLY